MIDHISLFTKRSMPVPDVLLSDAHEIHSKALTIAVLSWMCRM